MATSGGLEGMEGLILEMIVYRIGAKDAAVLGCASTRLRTAASDDTVWSRFCAKDFNLSEPVDPDGNRLPSFKVLFSLYYSFIWLLKFCTLYI
jgi:F-box protein 3